LDTSASIFSISGTEAMRITSTSLYTASGINVGIGTSSPASGSGGGLTLGTTTSGKSLHVYSSSYGNNGIANFYGTDGVMKLQMGALGASTAYIYANTGCSLALFSGGNQNATLDSSGNLGLGVTPSLWSTSYRAFEFGSGSLMGRSTNTDIYLLSNSYLNTSGNFVYKSSAAAGYYSQATGVHYWLTAASGTAGDTISWTQAMTLDANGNLGVGATSPTVRLSLAAASGGVWLGAKSGSNSEQLFGSDSSGNAAIFAQGSNIIALYTNATERARITSGGYSKFSNDGTYVSSTGSYHEFRQTADEPGVQISATNASFSRDALAVRASRNTTNNSFYAISYFNDGAGAYKLRVADSGNVTNTNGSYGTISDAKMKTDIVDAGSQWGDIKAIRFRKFKMKDDPEQIVQLGVVAQEVEQVSPGLVDEHADRDAEGNDLGTTTKSVKTSVLLMKAAVALQEAMARIEQLEAKVAALESK
jgi:hypothetical protein